MFRRKAQCQLLQNKSVPSCFRIDGQAQLLPTLPSISLRANDVDVRRKMDGDDIGCER
jgi:hypothetical protein